MASLYSDGEGPGSTWRERLQVTTWNFSARLLPTIRSNSWNLCPARLQQAPESRFPAVVDVQHDGPPAERPLNNRQHSEVSPRREKRGIWARVRVYLVLGAAALQRLPPAHGSRRQSPLLGGDGGQGVEDGAAAPLVVLLLPHKRRIRAQLNGKCSVLCERICRGRPG